MSKLSGGQIRKTWHFTSVLTPTHEINSDFFRLRQNANVNIERASIDVVGYWIKRQVLNEARPTCVNYISWRFSRTDVAEWFSKTEARTPLQDLIFEGYIQASHAIDISRLASWIRDAHWTPLGMKLADCEEYKSFCASGDAYEVCSDGTPAVARAGRPKQDKVSLTAQCHAMPYHLPFHSSPHRLAPLSPCTTACPVLSASACTSLSPLTPTRQSPVGQVRPVVPASSRVGVPSTPAPQVSPSAQLRYIRPRPHLSFQQRHSG